MTVNAMYNGIEVKADPFLPEFIDLHKKERKWAHRVMWRRCQRFTITQRRLYIKVGSCLHAHPNTVELLKQQIPSFEAVQ